MEKAIKITRRLEALQEVNNETLKSISSIILEKVKFYDKCLMSWEQSKPTEKYSLEEIEMGKKCCNAALDMADNIVNELRILHLGKDFY